MDLRVLTVAEQWAVAGVATTLGLVASAAILSWQARRLSRIDQRVAQLTAALALLTDTAEAGFADLHRADTRATDATAPTRRANRQRRVRTAAQRGRSTRDIAAAEQLSEGEVRLMLQMSGSETGERRHADLR
jgi:DNA-binding NarL/FixJ family response regulator